MTLQSGVPYMQTLGYPKEKWQVKSKPTLRFKNYLPDRSNFDFKHGEKLFVVRDNPLHLGIAVMSYSTGKRGMVWPEEVELLSWTCLTLRAAT
jgi:hypothetical protein